MLNNHKVNSQEIVLPPASVLWAWLSYIYRSTGEWLMPPDFTMVEENSPTVAKNVSFFPTATSLAANTPANVKLVKSEEEPGTNKRPTSSPTPLASSQTNFNYVNSPYFKEAEYLIANCASDPLKAELLFGCKQTLALIIAWCHHPLFNGTGNRQAEWMMLSFGHFARELHLRAATVQACLNELERVGLITQGNLKSGIISREEFERLRYDCAQAANFYLFWSPRAIQEKNTIYRLKVAPGASLPVFNPFPLDSEAGKTRKELDITNSPQELAGSTLNELDSDLKVAARSFPVNPSCKHESNNDDEKKEFKNQTKNEYQPEEFLAGLDETQQAKFLFLEKEACFSGFSREDGRTTLDRQQALKFALDPNLTLEKIQERYEQVREMWQKGQCRKNPIGLLHWTLTADCDPRTPNKPVHLSSKFQSRSSLNSNGARSRSFQPGRSKPTFGSKKAATFSYGDTESYSEEGLAAELATQETLSSTEASPIPVEPATLWQLVCEDLIGRFRLGQEKARLMEGSSMKLLSSSDNGKPNIAMISLRSIIEHRALDLATRNTIEIALRQRLGTGYQVRFEVNY